MSGASGGPGSKGVRAVLVATAVAGLTAAGAAAGAGTAAAADPILVGDCSTTITGSPGQPITLSGAAVLQPVTQVLQGLPLLGNLLASVTTSLSAASIPLGVVPGSSTTLTGADITRATTAQPGLGALGATVTGAITEGCRIVVNVVNQAAAPVQTGAEQVGGALQTATEALPQVPVPGRSTPAPAANPGSSSGGGAPAAAPQGASPQQAPATASPAISGSVQRSELGDLLALSGTGPSTAYSFGRVPLYTYAGQPLTVAGGSGRAPAPGVFYGTDVPGYAPEFGILGAGGEGGADEGVARASQVEALSTEESATVGLATLLAALALSLTSGAVVRTWVLRRATA